MDKSTPEYYVSSLQSFTSRNATRVGVGVGAVANLWGNRAAPGGIGGNKDHSLLSLLNSLRVSLGHQPIR